MWKINFSLVPFGSDNSKVTGHVTKCSDFEKSSWNQKIKIEILQLSNFNTFIGVVFKMYYE